MPDPARNKKMPAISSNVFSLHKIYLSSVFSLYSLKSVSYTHLFLTSSAAYFVGWSSRNACPKQAENVGVGSVTVSYTHLDVYKRQGTQYIYAARSLHRCQKRRHHLLQVQHHLQMQTHRSRKLWQWAFCKPRLCHCIDNFIKRNKQHRGLLLSHPCTCIW